MNIKKYIIKEGRKGFKTTFEIMDEFENPVTRILFNAFSGKMNAIEYDGAVYELRKRSMFSFRHDIFKNGDFVCSVGLKHGFSGTWLIQYPDKTIAMRSNMSFKNINFYLGDDDVAQASRKSKKFKAIFGLAVYEDVDAIVFMISLVNRLMQLRAAMAGV